MIRTIRIRCLEIRKPWLFVDIDINTLQKNEGFWGVGELYFIFLELCSVVGQTWPLLCWLNVILSLRGYWWLVTWGYSWHVTWHFDILINILTCVSLMIWLPQGLSKYVSHCQKLKDLLFISWLMTTGGRKFVTHVITKYLLIEGVLLIEKRNWAFDYWKKKSLEGTLSFWNWVLNNKQKCHVYCFIFKPPLYFICIKIILFCLCSQYLSSRSVTHDKSRA